MVDGLGDEGELHDPSAAILLPRGPTLPDRVRVGESAPDDRAEGDAAAERIGLVRELNGHRERGLDHELAFGEHGALEALHVVERHTGDGRDIFR